METERLVLRQWRDEDLGPFASLNADPVVMEHFPKTASREESDRFAEGMRVHIAMHGWGLWAVERKDDGAFIGFVGLKPGHPKLSFSPCVEIAWRLARRFWKNGYATEAARACLADGFERVGLDEVVTFTARRNRPSIAVMERIGLRNRNRDFEHPAIPKGHSLRWHVLYGMTREEWEPETGIGC